MNSFLALATIAGEAQPSPLPWWFWLVLAGALAVILWWMWYQGRGAISPAVEEVHPAAKSGAMVASEADDLKIIEGIGPKISLVLQTAGVRTFADLAGADIETLKKILLEANLHLADPTTWPEQAALARDGKLDELRALQKNLTAGRK